MKLLFILISLLLCQLEVSSGANILGVFTSPGPSHVIVDMAVVRELINKGHNVTVVTVVPLTNPDPRLHHIQLNATEAGFQRVFTEMIRSSSFTSRISQFFSNLKGMIDLAHKALKQEKFEKILAKEAYDLVLIGYFLNDFQLGIGQHFKCPTIVIWTAQTFGFINEITGNPREVSHLPNPFLGKNIKNFWVRVANCLTYVIEITATLLYNNLMQNYYEDLFPQDKYPSFAEARKNVSLILCNHHFTDGPIRANVPGIVEIGGIQIKPKPDPLPKDIQVFLDNSNINGAIFFSLGSNVHSTDLQPETIKIIYKVLSELKQNVLWKWENEENTPGKSKNILFKKWLPQDDILANPNIRLFITHGGKGSVVESQYHGIPMVGLPIFADQPMNIENVVMSGFGVGLNYQTLTEIDFRNAIQEVLSNSTYKDNVEKYSNLYRDRPMSARDTAVYWIEYVIRHRGAPHLQSQAIHLNKIQYLGLDVLALFAVIIYIWYKLSMCTLKLIWAKFCRKDKKVAQKNSKKNKKPKNE